MRYLGLDLGTRTLGLAISDMTGTIATSFGTLHFIEENELIVALKTIIEKEQIDQLILGYPKNMNNTIGPRAENTERFQKQIEEQLQIPVFLQDERLSTVAAHQYMLEADLSRKKRKQKVDAVAASIILQTYLDREKGKQL